MQPKADSRIEELEKKLKELESQKEHETKDVELPFLKTGDSREVLKYEKFKFADKYHVKHKPEKSFLITILFSNGTMKTFVIVSKEELFSFRKRNYYLRYENSWFDINHKMYHLFYFDDYVSPIEREVVQQGDKEYFAVKPSNIAPLLKMEYVKALASSDLSKWIKMVLMITFIVLMVSLAGTYFGYHGDKIIQQVLSLMPNAPTQ